MASLRQYVSAVTVSILIILGWPEGLALAQSPEGRARHIDFDGMAENTAPAGFLIALTGEGGAPVWMVQDQKESESASKIVVQSSSKTKNYRFPLCIYDDFVARDVEVSVRFRSMSGRIDQAGGLVWRYRDAMNYYVVRANALENNVVLYKVHNGRRSDLRPAGTSLLAYGKDTPVATGRWSTLRVVVRGDVFSIWLNEAHLFNVEDETFQTAGKV